jgi:competence protein ComEA
MTKQQPSRAAEPRALEGPLALSNLAGGRSSAPRLSSWAPVAAKILGGVAAAVLLSVIGLKTSSPETAPPSTSPPTVLVASVLPSGPAQTSATDPQTPQTASADGGAEPSPAVSPGQASPSGTLPDGRVVLNAASEEDLRKLPGIGPSRARAILALRQRLARFRAVEDLLRVKGIGRKTLRRLKPLVVLDRPPDTGGEPKGATPPHL